MLKRAGITDADIEKIKKENVDGATLETVSDDDLKSIGILYSGLGFTVCFYSGLVFLYALMCLKNQGGLVWPHLRRYLGSVSDSHSGNSWIH
jgi:hypothetical protein